MEADAKRLAVARKFLICLARLVCARHRVVLKGAGDFCIRWGPTDSATDRIDKEGWLKVSMGQKSQSVIGRK